jgi:hypothetical protein
MAVLFASAGETRFGPPLYIGYAFPGPGRARRAPSRGAARSVIHHHPCARAVNRALHLARRVLALRVPSPCRPCELNTLAKRAAPSSSTLRPPRSAAWPTTARGVPRLLPNQPVPPRGALTQLREDLPTGLAALHASPSFCVRMPVPSRALRARSNTLHRPSAPLPIYLLPPASRTVLDQPVPRRVLSWRRYWRAATQRPSCSNSSTTQRSGVISSDRATSPPPRAPRSESALVLRRRCRRCLHLHLHQWARPQ